MKYMKQKELEIALQSIPSHPSPRPELEQYPTPAPIAAYILYLALSKGDIHDKKVLDLGCGTGVFAIGAALLGAKDVTGIDIDEVSLAIAEKASRDKHVAIRFIRGDINDVGLRGDTVLQNPPFGSQRRMADRPFLEKALSFASVVYTIHKSQTREFIGSFVEKRGFRITHSQSLLMEIGYMFHFHRKEHIRTDVTLFRIER